MTSNELKKEIVLYLKTHHLGKWVTPAIAVQSLDPEAFTALNYLVEVKVIERKEIKYHKGQFLVRYVDNHIPPTLTLIQGGKE